MAYIVNISDDSGYTRDDFVAAMQGKQDKLYSSQNIKTVGGKSVLGSGNLDFTQGGGGEQQEYPQEALLTETEKQYRVNTLARIDELNPIVNGKRKYMMFGFISDLHSLPTNPEINAINDADMRADVQNILDAGIVFPNWDGNGNVTDAAAIVSYIKESWPTSDGYYGANAEPAVRLLGAIAHAADFDAVFCGGDLSSGRLPYNCYSYQLYQTKKMFDKYVTVPHYFTDGNHERKYNNNVIRRTNTEWLKWLNLMNSGGATYISGNDDRYGDKGNVYYVDFPRHKVRAVGSSSYENTDSFSAGYANQPCPYNLFDALSFENPQDAENWTALAFSHYNGESSMHYILRCYFSGERIGQETGAYSGSSSGYMAGFMNPDKSTTNSKYQSQYDSTSKNAQYGRGFPGKAAIGWFSGHVHDSANGFYVTVPGEGDERNLLNSAVVAHARANGGYTFSIFIIDDDEYKVRCLRYGPTLKKYPEGFDPTATEYVLDYRHH